MFFIYLIDLTFIFWKEKVKNSLVVVSCEFGILLVQPCCEWAGGVYLVWPLAGWRSWRTWWLAWICPSRSLPPRGCCIPCPTPAPWGSHTRCCSAFGSLVSTLMTGASWTHRDPFLTHYRHANAQARCPLCTHRFIVDQIMYNGWAAIILLDPADFHGVAFGFQLPNHFRRVWISCSNMKARWSRVKGLFHEWK